MQTRAGETSGKRAHDRSQRRSAQKIRKGPGDKTWCKVKTETQDEIVSSQGVNKIFQETQTKRRVCQQVTAQAIVATVP